MSIACISLVIAMCDSTIRLTNIYVAPNGSASGNGTKECPLDLATALAGRNSLIQPGITIWLLGGTYRGAYDSHLTGTPEAPIIVRQSPGERATIDNKDSNTPALTINGSWTIYRDFEITNSDPDRVYPRPNGVMVFGHHTKLINLIVHDTGVGIGFWTPAVDSEIYGCVVFRNGWQGPPPDRGHGHGIYAQNAEGTKRMVDNIIFDQYGYGIHNYAQAGELKGFHIEGNIIFGNGSSARPDDADEPNILVGGYNPAERVTLLNNCTYHPWNKIATNVWLNYSAQNNKDLIVKGNYLAGGTPLILTEWLQATIEKNTLIGPGGLTVLRIPAGVSTTDYSWDYNNYYTNNSTSASQFVFGTQGKSASYTLNGWRQVTGFDRNSQLLRSASARPSGAKVLVRPNLYEEGRANIAVYNWGGNETVDVDLSSVLSIGDRYEVRNVYYYLDQPVVSGNYDGNLVRLNMTDTKTGPEFNAFVLITKQHRKQ